jgi:hypothetical protein
MPTLIEKEWADGQKNALITSFQNMDFFPPSYIATELSKIGSLLNSNFVEQMKQMGETLNESFAKSYLPMISNLESHANLAKQLIDSIRPPEFPEISELYYRPTSPIIDLDFSSDSEESELVQESDFGMIAQEDGLFSYKDRILMNISLGSKHGKFLKRLLDNENHFVQDDNLVAEVDIVDPIKGVGYVVNDLKKFLKLDGVGIKLQRVRKYGFKLLGFEEIGIFPIYSLKS